MNSSCIDRDEFRSAANFAKHLPVCPEKVV